MKNVQHYDRRTPSDAGGPPSEAGGTPSEAVWTTLLAAALTALALVWTLLVVTAPVAATRNGIWLSALAASAYHAGSLVCHQRPERSFHVAGRPMAVCARCFGLYVAGAAGLLVAWGIGRRWAPATVRRALALGALPIAMTVALEWVGAIDTSNLFRMVTGLPAGLVGGLVINGLLRGPA